MNHTSHPITRLAALAATVLSLLLITAGQAAAMNPLPDPSGPGGTDAAPTAGSAQPVVDSSIGTLQWVLFTAAVLGALTIGAALMNLVLRHRGQLAN